MFRHGFVVLTLAFLAAGAAAHQPPTNLHSVGDHWTAWDPPTVFPDGAEIYRVSSGDTLWDLAGSSYGNPYLWPQIWEKNPYILDAHWIYPGDPLVMAVDVTPIEDVRVAATTDEVAGDQDDSSGLRLGSGIGSPEALGSENDIYCSGFIGDIEATFPRRIVGSEYQSLVPTLVAAKKTGSQYGDIDSVKIDLSNGDIVYIDGGEAQGLFPGDLFTVVIPREKIENPHTQELIGRFYSYVSRVRVLSVQEDSGIAEIVHSCLPVRVGAALVPFEEVPVPLARRGAMVGFNEPVDEASLDRTATIVYSQSGIVSLGQDHVVYIDRGVGDDVVPGDIYTIYRKNKSGLPPVVIGEVGVLSVHERSSVCRILESRYTVRVGDRLVPKR